MANLVALFWNVHLSRVSHQAVKTPSSSSTTSNTSNAKGKKDTKSKDNTTKSSKNRSASISSSWAAALPDTNGSTGSSAGALALASVTTAAKDGGPLGAVIDFLFGSKGGKEGKGGAADAKDVKIDIKKGGDARCASVAAAAKAAKAELSAAEEKLRKLKVSLC